MSLIDSHLHVWRAASHKGMPAAGLPHTIVPPTADVPLDLAREVMADHGVERAVLVQPVFRGEDNSYVADAARAEPERFAAVCVVDPLVPGATARLAEWVGRGCRGLRLRPRLPAESAVFGDPATYPLWEAAERLNVVVSVLADMEHAGAIAGLAQRFVGVPIVVDHFAHPDLAESRGYRQLLDLAEHRNVYVKLSGFHHVSRERFPYTDCRPLVRAVYEHFGGARLLWGSDFPHVLLASSYSRCRLLVEQMLDNMSDRECREIMGESAHRLYWPGN